MKDQDLWSVKHARSNDPDTSKQAACENKLYRNELMRSLLMAFLAAGQTGFTDEEAGERVVGLLNRSWWKRCSDLRAVGFIEPTGEKRRTSQGSLARVSRITKSGCSAVTRVYAKLDSERATNGE